MALDEYRTFIRVVELGSFTDAARDLGVSKSFVSKQVSRLEDRLGVRLLNRTTRQLSATEIGVRFHERAQDFLAAISAAEDEARTVSGSLTGSLRIAVPMSFGMEYLSTLLARFLAEHPGVRIDADYSDRKVDVVAEGFDLAVRIGSLADSSLVGRRLAPIKFHVVASPAYLEARGRPSHPSELAHHDAVLYRHIAANHTQGWEFRPPDEEPTSVRVSGRFLTNSGEALRDAVIAGLGVARLPDFLVAREIAEGSLEAVLVEWESRTPGIWAIFPHNRHVSATVRALVDYLAGSLKPALHGTA